jgi:hypothetical protein
VFPATFDGRTTIDVRHPDYAPRALSVTSPREDQIIEMSPGITWTGHVVLPDGQRLEDCWVHVEVRPESLERSRCSPDGFRLKHLPAGDAQVVVASGEKSVLGLRSLRQSVHIESVDMQRDVEWPAGMKVDGEIVDSDGRPVPHARVSATAKSALSKASTAIVFTDALGHFEFRDLPPEAWRLTADLRGSESTQLEIDGSANHSGLHIVLPTRGR